MSPLAAPRRSHVALIQLRGNGVVARNAGPLDLFNDRQHIGRKLPRIRLYSGSAAFCSLSQRDSINPLIFGWRV